LFSYDLLVIGGGINGIGIARDAAGRGLSVLLVEKGDLGGATSWISSKLIHGGLRYLEHFEFRLVAESLAEREVLLSSAGHLVWPIRFVMPHVADLRPRWMIRFGLFLYDHLARRARLENSKAVRLDMTPYGNGLRSEFRHGFAYSDCRADDARLVIANALDARARGVTVLARTECVSARREPGQWRVALREAGAVREVTARAVVNAAGPWVKQVLDDRLHQSSRESVRLVKGSHIVLPKLYDGGHAFILQNSDGRVVFMIPFEERYTLVGTTDVSFEGDLGSVVTTRAESEYLCAAINLYLAKPVSPEQVVWSFSGVRPLYDDGKSDPSEITRDYTLRVDDEAGKVPVLSVYGGKLTTYRRLAEHALAKLRPYFPAMGKDWTRSAILPGSDFGGGTREQARTELVRRYCDLPETLVHGIFRRHGGLATEVLGDARSIADLGEDFGAGLCEREVRYLVEREWAHTAEDVMWRRTKCGLHLDARARERVRVFLGG